MAELVAVCVGLPEEVAWRNATVRTAVWKSPVAGPRMVRRLNVDGDGQADLGGHGGEQRAVLVYQLDSYRYWQRELGRDDFGYGQFGENFTVEGMADDEVCIGDRYRIGGAVFEVTQPRVTCYRVGVRMNEPRMAALLVSHRRPGFYLRVLTEGLVRAGDQIVKTASGPEAMTVAEIDALLYLPNHPRRELERALRIPALSPGWQGSLRDLLDLPDTDGSKGNVGLNQAAASPPPAWSGFRPLRLTRIEAETPTVSSLWLTDPGGATMPDAQPGQYIALRLRPDAAGAPLIRSYSLSGPPGAADYRISVKRERHGAASTYVHEHLQVGDNVDVAAPRGVFTPRSGERPVLLMSAGIGVTPVLAMLHALAAERSGRQVWWLHGARNGAEHAFAGEARALLSALPNARSHVCFSQPGPADEGGESYGTLGPAQRRRGDPTGSSARRRGLSVRTGSVHERARCRSGRSRLRTFADPYRDVRCRRTHHARRRRRPGRAAASADWCARARTRGVVRPEQPHRQLGRRLCRRARAGRSMQRADSLVLPYGRLSHLRDAGAVRFGHLLPRTRRLAGQQQHPHLLCATEQRAGPRHVSTPQVVVRRRAAGPMRPTTRRLSVTS
jgi:ferredoxin-NADP reductase/MOSC domain-containing protein YiiM